MCRWHPGSLLPGLILCSSLSKKFLPIIYTTDSVLQIARGAKKLLFFTVKIPSFLVVFLGFILTYPLSLSISNILEGSKLLPFNFWVSHSSVISSLLGLDLQFLCFSQQGFAPTSYCRARYIVLNLNVGKGN